MASKNRREKIKKEWWKQDLGKNEALRSGGGFHNAKGRAQNELFRQIEEELELMEEDYEASVQETGT